MLFIFSDEKAKAEDETKSRANHRYQGSTESGYISNSEAEKKDADKTSQDSNNNKDSGLTGIADDKRWMLYRISDKSVDENEPPKTEDGIQ